MIRTKGMRDERSEGIRLIASCGKRQRDDNMKERRDAINLISPPFLIPSCLGSHLTCGSVRPSPEGNDRRE